MKTTTLGVKVDEATRKRLESLGEARQHSAHWLVKEAIKRFLEEGEAAERMKRETREAWGSSARRASTCRTRTWSGGSGAGGASVSSRPRAGDGNGKWR